MLLAAGSGSRFGGDKLLAALPRGSHLVPAGTAIGVAACGHLCAAVPETLAVVRPDDRRLIATLSACNVEIVECPRADEGMGASLACGVTAAQDAEGWIVALADMPWIMPATVARVVDAIASGAPIAAPRYCGERGHPVGFARRYGDALRALEGDEGARSIIAANAADVTLIDVGDPGVVRDIDTPGELDTTPPRG